MLFALAGGVVFVASLAYGVTSYLGRFGVPAGDWSWTNAERAILVNAGLFTLFAAHHSLFARTGLKAWVANRVTPALERSVYVWLASTLFILTCWLWRPVPGVAWTTAGAAAVILVALQLVGVLLTGHASKQLGVFDLAGVRQAAHAPPTPFSLVRSGGYRLVRHPIYLGWVLMVWATPTMTGTRLTFAAISTLYLVLAVPFEERTLRATLGEDYTSYTRRVRWRIFPFLY